MMMMMILKLHIMRSSSLYPRVSNIVIAVMILFLGTTSGSYQSGFVFRTQAGYPWHNDPGFSGRPVRTEEGSRCHTSHQRSTEAMEGVCTSLLSCPALQRSFKISRPKICSFKGRVPIVCCPLYRVPRPSSVIGNSARPSLLVDNSATVTLDNSIESSGLITAPSLQFECGIRATGSRLSVRGGVVGGRESNPLAWPWMARLGHIEASGGGKINWLCSGMLISPRHVLTAAHCVSSGELNMVRLGTHDVTRVSNTAMDVSIFSYRQHPQYQVGASKHDLAIITLTSPVQLSSRIRPICLPWDNPANILKEQIIGRSLTVTGWGSTVFGGDQSAVLREATVKVMTPESCDASYKSLPDYQIRFPGGIDETFLCAGGNGNDACEGDSGAPMVYNSFGRYTVAGVVTAGHGCGNAEFPGLYSNVKHYLSWIKGVAF